MRRNPPARWVLPETVDPAVRRCIQIDVPDDPAHIAAFRGAMLSLASAYNWSDDPTHKAKDVALVWREIIDSHLEWGCGLAIEFMQDECGLSFREVGSETWIPIYDGLECLDSNGAHQLIDGYIGDYIDQLIDDGVLQPGNAQQGPQPAPASGECITYHVHLAANDVWHCPSPIQAKSRVHITNYTGGWNDGAVYWYCPDGTSYGLGSCTPGTGHTESGDPINTVNHMRVVGHLDVDDTYFDPMTAAYTIPANTDEQGFTLQANDATLSDNYGSVDFDVEVCTGTLIAISYVFGETDNPTTVPTGNQAVFTFHAHPVYGAGFVAFEFDRACAVTVIGYTGSPVGTPATYPWTAEQTLNHFAGPPWEQSTNSYPGSSSTWGLALWNTTDGATITLEITEL